MSVFGGSAPELDNTVYPDDKIPEVALRSLMATLRIPTAWRKAFAREDMLQIETVSVLGSSETTCEKRVTTIFGADFSSEAKTKEVEMTKILALWQSCRDIKAQRCDQRLRMTEDPLVFEQQRVF